MESTKRNVHSIVFQIDAPKKKKKIKANTPNVSKIDIKEKETTCGDNNFFYWFLSWSEIPFPQMGKRGNR